MASVLIVGSVLWMTHKLKRINILMYYTLMMVEMSGVNDNNIAVINTLYIASTCGEVNLMGRIESKKFFLFSMSCSLF